MASQDGEREEVKHKRKVPPRGGGDCRGGTIYKHEENLGVEYRVEPRRQDPAPKEAAPQGNWSREWVTPFSSLEAARRLGMNGTYKNARAYKYARTCNAKRGEQELFMIPNAPKRLVKVDFPIAAVWKHSAWEKSILDGHPRPCDLGLSA